MRSLSLDSIAMPWLVIVKQSVDTAYVDKDI